MESNKMNINKTAYQPNVKIKKIYSNAKMPVYSSNEAACADLYAYIPFNEADMVNNDGKCCKVIMPHSTVKIGTGLTMAPETGWYVQLYARSGLATKNGLAPANKVGVIDNDYRGEYVVPLHNHSDMPQTIVHGDRIAQMAITPYWAANFEEVDKLDETERGEGGFGSSGK